MITKNRREVEEKRISPPDSKRADFETTEALSKSKAITGRAAAKSDSQAPIQPVSDRFPALENLEIILTLFAPDAREVHVAGEFNSWRPEAAPLKKDGAGKWLVHLMLRSGQYEYRFIVDGRWVEDPEVSQRVANTYGGFNSVLKVPLEDRAYIL